MAIICFSCDIQGKLFSVPGSNIQRASARNPAHSSPRRQWNPSQFDKTHHLPVIHSNKRQQLPGVHFLPSSSPSPRVRVPHPPTQHSSRTSLRPATPNHNPHSAASPPPPRPASAPDAKPATLSYTPTTEPQPSRRTPTTPHISQPRRTPHENATTNSPTPANHPQRPPLPHRHHPPRPSPTLSKLRSLQPPLPHPPLPPPPHHHPARPLPDAHAPRAGPARQTACCAGYSG